MSAQIPSTAGVDPTTRKVLDALKENMEVIRGRRLAKISKLATDATLAQTVAKVNEIIARLQG